MQYTLQLQNIYVINTIKCGVFGEGRKHRNKGIDHILLYKNILVNIIYYGKFT